MNGMKMTLVLAIMAAMISPEAVAADNLICMDSGYDTENEAAFSAFREKFTLEGWDKDGASDATLGAISVHAGLCADEHGWSPAAIEKATQYGFTAMMLAAIEHQSGFSRQQLGRFAAAVADADQTQLQTIMTKIYESGMKGEKASLTDSEMRFLARISLRAGLPNTQATGSFSDAWLGAYMMREAAKQQFSSL